MSDIGEGSGGRGVAAYADPRLHSPGVTDPSDLGGDSDLDPAIEEALAFLRGHLSGLLRFDGDYRPVKVVVADDGKLVAPAMVAMLRAIETILFLPDEEETAIHVQVTLDQLDENGSKAALCDRWRIYHGDPPDVRWAEMTIDAARFQGLFIDGEGLMRPNPLARQVPTICKFMNGTYVDLLRAACLQHAKIGVERPLVVGVDPFGLDVRGTFDIVRLDSPIVLRSERDALLAVRELAGES